MFDPETDLPPESQVPGVKTPPGAHVGFTVYQAAQLGRIAERHQGSITVRDEGDAWLWAYLRGPEGEIVDQEAMPPI